MSQLVDNNVFDARSGDTKVENNDTHFHINGNNIENIPNKNYLDFDDLLPHLGEFGLYQKILFLLLCPFTLFFAIVYFTQIFITLLPNEYWCKVPELNHLNVEEKIRLSIPLIDGEYSKCSMYAVNFTALVESGTLHPDVTWPTQLCIYGWEFDHSEIPYTTIATELEWVCDKSALPTIAQSIFFCGAVVGGLIFGWIADYYGRIPALVATNLIGGLAGLGTAFTQNFWQFSLSRFFAGFAFDNCFTIMCILVLEYVGPSWRTFVTNMSFGIYFAAGGIAIPWIAVAVSNWQLFTIVTSAPLLLAIFTPWIVPESVRWLASQSQQKRTIKILHKFEKINGKTIDSQIYDRFFDTCDKVNAAEKDQNYSVLDLFRTPRMRRTSLLVIGIYMSIFLAFDGYVRSITEIGLNTFVGFSLSLATLFPASIIVTLLLDRWGRRWLGFGSMVLCGICNIWISFVLDNELYSIILLVTGTFFVNIGYNIGIQYSVELLPTVVRATGVAFIHNLGYLANIISPFVIYLKVVNPSLPFWILGIVGIFGGAFMLFLPETMGKDLPQTLNDGEQFGSDQVFWDIPCVSIKRKK